MDIVKEKITQAAGVLDELDIDLWLIFCRESQMMADPAIALVIGHDVVWQAAFFISRKGETVALMGNYDVSEYQKSLRFSQVLPYVKDCGREIKKIVRKFNPARIAINYSRNDCAADGLTHGLYLLLLDYLKDTPYADRLESSEKIISLLRGRKTESEISLITRAAKVANRSWEQSLKHIKVGMTEKEIAAIIEKNIRKSADDISFEALVNAGAKTPAGHGLPTDAILEPGDLLHVDFGAKVDGYCSDIQRLAYFRKPKETRPSQSLINAFNMVRAIIEKTSAMYCPGVKGYTIDKVARQMLEKNNYPVYQHALGHQIGRAVHDGAAIVGPRWKRYGNAAEIPLELNNAFTVELGIELEKIGYVGLEEDLIVTPTGGQFLGPVQTELVVI